MADLWALAMNVCQSLSESELHGIVCGVSAAAVEDEPLMALVDLLGADQISDAEALQAFATASTEDYYHPDFTFRPLLPGADEASLDERAEALADWCNGFMAGIGTGLDSRTLSDEAQEALGDLAAIGGMDTSPEPHEESERQLAEIEEFVKVAALLLQHSGKESD